MATGPPDAPGNFHVEKIVSGNSLMLAWQPVALDNQGCNNGVKVTGYKVRKKGSCKYFDASVTDIMSLFRILN